MVLVRGCACVCTYAQRDILQRTGPHANEAEKSPTLLFKSWKPKKAESSCPGLVWRPEDEEKQRE